MEDTCAAAEYMSEADVGARLARWLFEQGLAKVVTLCLDGTHIKGFNREIIYSGWNLKYRPDRWKAKWAGELRPYDTDWILEITSTPTTPKSPVTVCDLQAVTPRGRLRVECKKVLKRLQERSQLQAAIGQIVTVRDRAEADILAVGVPFSPTMADLAGEFMRSPVFQGTGVSIVLVHNHSAVDWWIWNGEKAECVPFQSVNHPKRTLTAAAHTRIAEATRKGGLHTGAAKSK